MQNIFKANYNNCEKNNLIQYCECENRGNKKKKKNFKTLKNNTINSLNDVEYFLNNLGQIFKGVKIYKLIRK